MTKPIKRILQAACTAIAVATPTHADNIVSFPEKILPSIVAVVSPAQQNAKSLTFGSGFVIGKGLVATNYHLIRDKRDGYIKQFSSPVKHQIGKLYAADADSDLAIVHCPSLSAPALPLGDSDCFVGGSLTHFLERPWSIFGVPDHIIQRYGVFHLDDFEKGAISFGFATIIAVQDTGKAREIDTVAADDSMSGGPLINQHGQVVGMTNTKRKVQHQLTPGVCIDHLEADIAVEPLKRLWEETEAKATVQ